MTPIRIWQQEFPVASFDGGSIAILVRINWRIADEHQSKLDCLLYQFFNQTNDCMFVQWVHSIFENISKFHAYAWAIKHQYADSFVRDNQAELGTSLTGEFEKFHKFLDPKTFLMDVPQFVCRPLAAPKELEPAPTTQQRSRMDWGKDACLDLMKEVKRIRAEHPELFETPEYKNIMESIEEAEMKEILRPDGTKEAYRRHSIGGRVHTRGYRP